MSTLTNGIIAQILDMTPQGVGKWKKENRPIINLLEKYFTKEELEEFLKTERIDKLENINQYFKQRDFLRDRYLAYFTKTGTSSVSNWDSQSTTPFWFGLLWFLKKYSEQFNSFQQAAVSFSLSEFNLIEKKDYYSSIEAIQKRTIPLLVYLDSYDGMYSYISSITKDNLLDLCKVDEKNEGELNEAKIQIQKFEDYEKFASTKIDDWYLLFY